MSEELEKIVASQELCEKIPAGEFEDSALVWRDRKGNISRDSFVKVREPEDISYANEFAVVCYYPAPTLAEIMFALSEMKKNDSEFVEVNVYCKKWEVLYGMKLNGDNSIGAYLRKKDRTNPADAALRLWFKLKRIEVK